MGQTIKSLASFGLCLSVCLRYYGRNFCSILMKFCIEVGAQKVRTLSLGSKSDDPSPILPKFFTPIMHFQWEGPNTAVTRPVDQLWRLRAQTTCLGSGYKHRVAKCCNSQFSPETQKWGSVHFQWEYTWPVFDTYYLDNDAR